MHLRIDARGAVGFIDEIIVRQAARDRVIGIGDGNLELHPG